MGIRKGDRVALHLDNCPEFIFAGLDYGKKSANMVPINTLTGRRKRFGSQNSEVSLLVTSVQFFIHILP